LGLVRHAEVARKVGPDPEARSRAVGEPLIGADLFRDAGGEPAATENVVHHHQTEIVGVVPAVPPGPQMADVDLTLRDVLLDVVETGLRREAGGGGRPRQGGGPRPSLSATPARGAR